MTGKKVNSSRRENKIGRIECSAIKGYWRHFQARAARQLGLDIDLSLKRDR